MASIKGAMHAPDPKKTALGQKGFFATSRLADDFYKFCCAIMPLPPRLFFSAE